MHRMSNVDLDSHTNEIGVAKMCTDFSSPKEIFANISSLTAKIYIVTLWNIKVVPNLSS